jgi:hypothetical protein
MDDLARALDEAGGTAAPRERTAQLRTLLHDELVHGRSELKLARSGRTRPVTVAVDVAGRAVAPMDPAVRVDAAALAGREWELLVALVGALADAGGAAPCFGEHDGALLVEAEGTDAELAALAFDERAARIDRLRARALALPPGVIDTADAKPAQATPLRAAVRIAALGGDPQDPYP